MYNQSNPNLYAYEEQFLNYNDDEQRKVHTPYFEAQDFFVQISSNIKPISSKIQFTLHDIALAKKAKSRKTKTTQDPNSNKKCGHWSSDENKRYHWFLELHHQHFFNKHLRRTDRIFKSMANFVQTRQAEQCRSHHQKMEKKYKYFSKILMSLRLQNYNSDDHEPILKDILQKSSMLQFQSILTSQQLRINSQNIDQESLQSSQIKMPKLKLARSEPTAICLPSIQKIQNPMLQEEHKETQNQGYQIFLSSQNYIDDIWDDTYQKHLNKGFFSQHF